MFFSSHATCEQPQRTQRTHRTCDGSEPKDRFTCRVNGRLRQSIHNCLSLRSLCSLRLNQLTIASPGTGDYVLRVRPYVSGRYLDFGPSLLVSALAPGVTMTGWARPNSSQFWLDFAAVRPASLGFVLLRSPDLSRAWSEDTSAALITTTNAPGKTWFFGVRSP